LISVSCGIQKALDFFACLLMQSCVCLWWRVVAHGINLRRRSKYMFVSLYLTPTQVKPDFISMIDIDLCSQDMERLLKDFASHSNNVHAPMSLVYIGTHGQRGTWLGACTEF